MQPEFQPDSREFLVRRLAGHTRPPETDLYHYTGGNGLIKIIHSGTLLVSQIGCLNDSMEVTYAFDLLQERMTQALQDRSRAPMHEVFHQIIRRLGSFRPEAMSVYVTSFTEDGDSLSQWRGYAEGEAGFAIGFDPAALARACRTQRCHLLKVEYRPERQHALLDDVIRWTEEHYTEASAQGAVRSADEFAAGWLETLTAIGACLKHPKFDDEREWRIIYYARDEDLARMQFVQRRSTISRHIPLSYREAPGDPGLPVSEVVMGPCRYPDTTRYAVADLLKARGYRTDGGVVIRISRIPYRLI